MWIHRAITPCSYLADLLARRIHSKTLLSKSSSQTLAARQPERGSGSLLPLVTVASMRSIPPMPPTCDQLGGSQHVFPYPSACSSAFHPTGIGYLAHLADRSTITQCLPRLNPAVSPEFPLPSPLLKTGGGLTWSVDVRYITSHQRHTPSFGSLAIPTTHPHARVRHMYQDGLDSLLICFYSTLPTRPRA